jgi:hypothetical protein
MMNPIGMRALFRGSGQQTATYQFDGNTIGGLGVRTLQGVGTPTGNTYPNGYQVAAQDSFQRPTEDLAQPLNISLGSTSGPALGTISGGSSPSQINFTPAPDAAGNYVGRAVSGWQSQTLTWDSLNRLVGISETNTGSYQSGTGYNWTAVYDGLGRRVQTTYQNTGSGTSLVTDTAVGGVLSYAGSEVLPWATSIFALTSS